MDEEMEGYVIAEIQVASNGTISPLFDAVQNRNSALSVFYQKCSCAAISDVPVHTVVICDIYGNKLPDINPVTFVHKGGNA